MYLQPLQPLLLHWQVHVSHSQHIARAGGTRPTCAATASSGRTSDFGSKYFKEKPRADTQQQSIQKQST